MGRKHPAQENAVDKQKRLRREVFLLSETMDVLEDQPDLVTRLAQELNARMDELEVHDG